MFKIKNVLLLSYFLFSFSNMLAMADDFDRGNQEYVNNVQLLESQCLDKIISSIYSTIASDGFRDDVHEHIDRILEIVPEYLQERVGTAVYAAIAEFFGVKKDIFTTKAGSKIKKNIIAQIQQESYIPRKIKKLFCDSIESNPSYADDVKEWLAEDIEAFKLGFISGFKYTSAWVFGLYIADCIKYMTEMRSLQQADVLLHNTHDLEERLLHIPEIHGHIGVLRESLALVKGMQGVQNRAFIYKHLLGAASIGSFAALYTQQIQSAAVAYLQEEAARTGKMRNRFPARFVCGAIMGFTAALLMKKGILTIGKEVFKNLVSQEIGIEDIAHYLNTIEQDICNLPHVIFQKILDDKQFPQVVEVCLKKGFEGFMGIYKGLLVSKDMIANEMCKFAQEVCDTSKDNYPALVVAASSRTAARLWFQ